MNIKKLIPYLIPILLLPRLTSFPVTYFTIKTGEIGSQALSAYSTATNVAASLFWIPALIPVLACLFVAAKAESGRIAAAKSLHFGLLMAFCGLYFIISIALMIFADNSLGAIAVSPELIDMSAGYLRTYLLSLMLMTAAVTVLGQFGLKKFRWWLTLIIGAVMTLLSVLLLTLLVNVFHIGLNGVAIASAVRDVAGSVLPFVMISVSGFAASFVKVEATASDHAQAGENQPKPKSYLEMYREKRQTK